MKELFDIQEIVGIKYTSYDFYEMRAIIELGQERGLTVLSGPDEMCLPAQVMGAQGAIGTTFNILPGLYMKMYRAWRGGDLPTAQECQFAINRVIRALFTAPILGAVKEVLRAMGFDCGTTRLPLRPPTEEEKRLLWRKLAEAHFAELADVPVRA